jgi:hypothetical protein
LPQVSKAYIEGNDVRAACAVDHEDDANSVDDDQRVLQKSGG